MAEINYALAAASIDSNVSFVNIFDTTDYDSLEWNTAPILKSTLEAAWLTIEKANQVQKISSDMSKQVTSGFLSDALVEGEFRLYDSNIQGQIAVVGAMVYLTPVMGMTVPTTYTMSSIDPSTGIRGYAPHNYSQLYHLFGDLGTFSAGLVATLTSKITAIYTVNTGDVHTDLDAVYAITWT